MIDAHSSLVKSLVVGKRCASASSGDVPNSVAGETYRMAPAEQVLFGAVVLVAGARGAVNLDSDGAATGQPQGRFETLGQALFQIRAHLDAVNHHVNVCFSVFLSCGRLSNSKACPSTRKRT